MEELYNGAPILWSGGCGGIGGRGEEGLMYD